MTTYRDLVEIKVCARCGSTENLEVHHKNMNHYDDRRGNHIVLCRKCHRGLHCNRWELEDIGVSTPKVSYNPLMTGYYKITTADIQKELEEKKIQSSIL